MLGVFGDPEHTGKSAMDDLRTAQHTVLVSTALLRASPAEAQTLRSLLKSEPCVTRSPDTTPTRTRELPPTTTVEDYLRTSTARRRRG
ncbi:hypothetical protein ACFRI7_24540 [Streptomyces sp. NPDC056716]|uniref:hypothetical protein n=1 Tax=unclassified Streptomyces TaxID=2593676 RepID=UPI0036B3D4EF